MNELAGRGRDRPVHGAVQDPSSEPIAEDELLFTPLQVGIGTLLGGLMAGAAMVMSNFRRVDSPFAAALVGLLSLPLAPCVGLLVVLGTTDNLTMGLSLWGFGALVAGVLTKVLQGARTGDPRQGRSWAMLLLFAPLGWAVTAVACMGVVVVAVMSVGGR